MTVFTAPVEFKKQKQTKKQNKKKKKKKKKNNNNKKKRFKGDFQGEKGEHTQRVKFVWSCACVGAKGKWA